MSEKILIRFCIIAGVCTFLMFSIWGAIRYLNPPAGDYEVRQGDILLGEGKLDAALARFNVALEKSPHHRGALMGVGIVYLQKEDYENAEDTFSQLIRFLTASLAEDDATGRAVLAGSYANRGILFDRMGKYDKALADYSKALDIDRGAVAGPNLVQRVLYGLVDASSIEKRAAYLRQQFSLPESERTFRVPEIDRAQRMHKP